MRAATVQARWAPSSDAPRATAIMASVATNGGIRPSPNPLIESVFVSEGPDEADKWIAENLAFGLVCRVGRRFPTMAPKVGKLVASVSAERELVDRSDRIFEGEVQKA